MVFGKSFKLAAGLAALLVTVAATFVFIRNSGRSNPGEFDGRDPQEGFQAQKETVVVSERDGDHLGTFTYTHPMYGFTITYPSAMNIGTFEEAAGDMVLLQDKTQGTIAQMYIQEFSEEGGLTPERIAKDLPGKKIENGKYILLDNRKVMMFDSEEEGIGRTWEVWFSYANYLYQISTKSENRPVLEPILSTWKFDN